MDRHAPLVAVLLNPPAQSSGVRSRNAVYRAARVLGYDDVVMTNLCSIATPSIVEVNGLGYEAWTSARRELELAVQSGAGVLAAWGVGGLRGDARRWLRAQVEWLVDCAGTDGIHSFWMVGGEPRHPSRWHQYVSDKHGRTRGGSFDERLAQVLIDVPTRDLPPATDHQDVRPSAKRTIATERVHSAVCPD